jgi:hypothetical protein
MSFPVNQAFPQQTYGQQTFGAAQQAFNPSQQTFGQQTFAAPPQTFGVPGAQFPAPQQQFGSQQMAVLPSRSTFAASAKGKKAPPKKRSFAQSIADADKDHNYLYWRPTIENAKASEQFRYKKGTNKSIADASSAFVNAIKDVHIFFSKYATNRPQSVLPEQIYFAPVFLYSIPRPIITPASAVNPSGSITYSQTEETVVRLFGSWIIVANKLAEYIREIAVAGGVIPTEDLYSRMRHDAAKFTDGGITQQIIQQGASSTDQRSRDLYNRYMKLAKDDQSKRGERRKESKWDPIYKKFKALIGPAPLKLKGSKGRTSKVTSLSQAFITHFPSFAVELLNTRRNNMTPGMPQQVEKYQSYREKLKENGATGIVTQKVAKRPQSSWIIEPMNIAVESSNVANTFLDLARKIGENNKSIADLVASSRIVPPLHATGATTMGFQFTPSAQYGQFQAFQQQYPSVAAARQSISGMQGQANQSFFVAPSQSVAPLQQVPAINDVQYAVNSYGAGGQVNVAPIQPQQITQPVAGIQSQDLGVKTPGSPRASPLLVQSPSQQQTNRVQTPPQPVYTQPLVQSPSQQQAVRPLSPTTRVVTPTQPAYVQPLNRPVSPPRSPSQPMTAPQVSTQPFTVDLSGIPSLGQSVIGGPATGQEVNFSNPNQ